jgi:hypothetical protein
MVHFGIITVLMSRRFPSFRRWGSLVAIAVIGSVAAGAFHLHAADTKETRRIFDWSADAGPEDTNSPSLPARGNGLRALEDDLNQPLRGLNPNRGSLDGRFSRPAPQAVPRQRTKDQSRRNWLSDTESDPVSDPFSGDKWNSDWTKALKDTRKEPSDSFTSRSFPTSSTTRQTDPSKLNPFGSTDESLPNGVRDTASNLRKLMEGNDSLTPIAPRSSFNDFFGIGATQTMDARDRELSRKAYLDQYKEILNVPTTSTLGKPAGTDLFATSPGATIKAPITSTPPFGTAPRSRAGFPEPQFGTINPRFSPEAVPDVNSRVLNSWNPMQVPSAPQAPAKATASTRPGFSLPKRAF